MPPVGRPAHRTEVANLRAWIDQGAKWRASSNARTWSFQPSGAAAAPDVRARAWVRNPIDAFVLARLESENHPAIARSRPRDPAAALVAWTSPVCLPRLQEMEAFLADNRPDCVRAGGGPVARIAALRREVGALLARSGALRR